MAKVKYDEDQRKEERKRNLLSEAELAYGELPDLIAIMENCDNWVVMSDSIFRCKGKVEIVEKLINTGCCKFSEFSDIEYENLRYRLADCIVRRNLHILMTKTYDGYPHYLFNEIRQLVKDGWVKPESIDSVMAEAVKLFRECLIDEANKRFSDCMSGKTDRRSTYVSIRCHYLISGITDEHSFNIDLVTPQQFQEYLAENPPVA